MGPENLKVFQKHTNKAKKTKTNGKMSPTHHNQQQRRNSVTTNSSENEDGPWQCCTPLGCIYNNGSNAEHILITKEDLRAGQEVVVKVICSNEQCKLSPYMHTACF